MKLRRLKLKDAPFMLEWMLDPDINRFFRFDAGGMTREKVESYIRASWENKDCLHCACVDESDEYLGTISLKNIDTVNKNAEYATSFRASAQGSGAALFASKEILKKAFFELGLHRVYLNVLEDNERAAAFYEKLGFKKEGRFRSHLEIKGERKNLLLYGMLKEEFKVSKADLVRMMEFSQRGDERGHLVVVEGAQDLPFDIKRVFYIYGSDAGVVRGQHANRRTEFVLINVAGTSKVMVKDGLGGERVYELDRPHIGIYLPTMVWKDMYDFSPDSVLLVLASEHYDPKEYIRDYEQFSREAAEND